MTGRWLPVAPRALWGDTQQPGDRFGLESWIGNEKSGKERGLAALRDTGGLEPARFTLDTVELP